MSSSRKQNGGIGIIWRISDEGLLVVKGLVPASPAAKSNSISCGDVLISIHDVPIDQLEILPLEIVSYLKGLPMEAITLGFVSNASGQCYSVALVRDEMHSSSSESPPFISKIFPNKDVVATPDGYEVTLSRGSRTLEREEIAVIRRPLSRSGYSTSPSVTSVSLDAENYYTTPSATSRNDSCFTPYSPIRELQLDHSSKNHDSPSLSVGSVATLPPTSQNHFPQPTSTLIPIVPSIAETLGLDSASVSDDVHFYRELESSSFCSRVVLVRSEVEKVLVTNWLKALLKPGQAAAVEKKLSIIVCNGHRPRMENVKAAIHVINSQLPPEFHENHRIRVLAILDRQYYEEDAIKKEFQGPMPMNCQVKVVCTPHFDVLSEIFTPEALAVIQQGNWGDLGLGRCNHLLPRFLVFKIPQREMLQEISASIRKVLAREYLRFWTLASPWVAKELDVNSPASCGARMWFHLKAREEERNRKSTCREATIGRWLDNYNRWKAISVVANTKPAITSPKSARSCTSPSPHCHGNRLKPPKTTYDAMTGRKIVKNQIQTELTSPTSTTTASDDLFEAILSKDDGMYFTVKMAIGKELDRRRNSHHADQEFAQWIQKAMMSTSSEDQDAALFATTRHNTNPCNLDCHPQVCWWIDHNAIQDAVQQISGIDLLQSNVMDQITQHAAESEISTGAKMLVEAIREFVGE